MGHEPNYITALPRGDAATVKLIRDVSAARYMAVRNGQPMPQRAMGFFFARHTLGIGCVRNPNPCRRNHSKELRRSISTPYLAHRWTSAGILPAIGTLPQPRAFQLRRHAKEPATLAKPRRQCPIHLYASGGVPGRAIELASFRLPTDSKLEEESQTC